MSAPAAWPGVRRRRARPCVRRPGRRRPRRSPRGRRLDSWRSSETSDPTASISLVLDIGQGAGLAGASGVRPFLPPLVAGALARADAGIDFEGGDFRFLESPWFLLAVLALAVAAYAAERWAAQRRGIGDGPGPADDPTAADPRLLGRTPLELAMLAIALVLGALLFAGTLADGGHDSWPGLVAGAGCALVGYLAVAGLFARARRRLDAGAASLLTAQADALSLVIATLSIFLEPVGYLALLAFVVLGLRAGGESERKYGGLRILR